MQKEQQNKKCTFAPAISTSYLLYSLCQVIDENNFRNCFEEDLRLTVSFEPDRSIAFLGSFVNADSPQILTSRKYSLLVRDFFASLCAHMSIIPIV